MSKSYVFALFFLFSFTLKIHHDAAFQRQLVLTATMENLAERLVTQLSVSSPTYNWIPPPTPYPPPPPPDPWASHTFITFRGHVRASSRQLWANWRVGTRFQLRYESWQCQRHQQREWRAPLRLWQRAGKCWTLTFSGLRPVVRLFNVGWGWGSMDQHVARFACFPQKPIPTGWERSLSPTRRSGFKRGRRKRGSIIDNAEQATSWIEADALNWYDEQLDTVNWM